MYRQYYRARDYGTSISVYGNLVTIPLTDILPAERVITAIRIHRSVVPQTVYNIVSANQTMMITVAAVNYLIGVPEGLYSGVALANTVSALFTTAMIGPGLTCAVSFDPISFKTTISVVNA